MNIQEIEEKLIAVPSYMEYSGPKLAKRWNCSLEDAYQAKLNVRNKTTETIVKEIIEQSKKEDLNKGTVESEVILDYEPKSHEELYKLHKIDPLVYKISTYWSKLKSNGKFTSSVLASLIKKDSIESFTNDFQEFLNNYKPTSSVIKILERWVWLFPGHH